jgi:hypothetical protein
MWREIFQGLNMGGGEWVFIGLIIGIVLLLMLFLLVKFIVRAAASEWKKHR